MKNAICSTIGCVGSVIAGAFGGMDSAIITLLLFMAIDYISGLLLAGVFHKSKKSESGALESRAGWKGLIKKGMTLVFVIVANRLDMQIGTSYIRDGVCIAFIVNELLSIIENAGLMGIPIPAIITNAIDVLKERSDSSENNQD